MILTLPTEPDRKERVMMRRIKTATFAIATLSVCLALDGTRTSLAQAPYPPGMGGQYQPGGAPQPGATYQPGIGGPYRSSGGTTPPGTVYQPGYQPGTGTPYQPGGTAQPGAASPTGTR